MDGDANRPYPAGLLDWAGHRVGGVKRLFHAASGRPAGDVVHTPLLRRLTRWAQSLAAGDKVPRVVLLVGGPGNGKTEAVEHTITTIDAAFGAGGELTAIASRLFDGTRSTPARLVTLDLPRAVSGVRALAVVQDASGSSGSKLSPPADLVQDLEQYVTKGSDVVYIACVNRGVLDDALAYAMANARHDAAQLIEKIIKSVGISPDAPECWPLNAYPTVGVWPMDVESLVEPSEKDQVAPAAQLLDRATDEGRWPVEQCPAGEHCPFCTSRRLLARDPHRESLLSILRWYELATGKRWTFRDLFSLVSYLLAGAGSGEESADPCKWAAHIKALMSRPGSKPESLRLAAPFVLAAAQYQHAMFMIWPREGVRNLRRAIQEVQLESHPGLMGFYHFLAMRRGASLPTTLESQLLGLGMVLDPAIADPDLEAAVSAQSTIKLRDLDVRFSQSVGEGFRFIKKYQCLSALEVDVLQRLDDADKRLSESDVVNRKPAVCARIQYLLRDFACRFVRRSIGCRAGIVRDRQTLAEFHSVVQGDPTLLHAAAKQVEGLLNERDRFMVVLNSTFGEPVPPPQRRATVGTEKQKVKPWPAPGPDRPYPSLRFLGVGATGSAQSIPLTFDLFRSVRELRQGMMPASLPRAVVALLDTTRARLAGRIVRDEALLDGAEIRIATKEDVIVRQMDDFVVLQRDS